MGISSSSQLELPLSNEEILLDFVRPLEPLSKSLLQTRIAGEQHAQIADFTPYLDQPVDRLVEPAAENQVAGHSRLQREIKKGFFELAQQAIAELDFSRHALKRQRKCLPGSQRP